MMETNRCKLVKLQETDYVDVKRLYSDVKVREFLGGPVSEEEFNAKFERMIKSKNDAIYWVIRQRESSLFIGLISLALHHDGVSTEVSYQLLPEWWGKGYATEVVKEVIRYAFVEFRLAKVIAETQTANLLSCRLLERVCMKLEQKVQRFGAEQAIYAIYNLSL
ncbi:GNAT family N-acetyltransferase [Clostridium thermosuccinogenes]|jgi:ribosomal-protein-alanine N-acetyltransferase|uniref:GNAT family N-acetyltransferase n=2 Tax=Clostridium thermosuccinogenes TaxID=84032 RepID=UPI000CCBE611|nr:GNAT family N-acetyltransferase [Pseudoclostridium thermosuccinogenes]PNT92822.1 GNAT family N-acetyltransferase [Pseudoclostridium thermosuccinogenes]